MKSRTVESREYKVMLNQEKFVGKRSELISKSKKFWKVFTKAIANVTDKTEGNLEIVEKERWINFYDTNHYFLRKNDYDVPARTDLTQPIEPSPDVQKALIQIYRENYMLMRVCERLVDLDEGIQEWRYRHVKMVERTIGTKKGTGGSAGTTYLRTTLFKSLFPDLWLIRSEL